MSRIAMTRPFRSQKAIDSGTGVSFIEKPASVGSEKRNTMPPSGGRLVRPISPRSLSSPESATHNGDVSTEPAEVEKLARAVFEALDSASDPGAGTSEQALPRARKAASVSGTNGRTMSSSHGVAGEPGGGRC